MKKLYILILLIMAVFVSALSTTFSYSTVNSEIGKVVIESNYNHPDKSESEDQKEIEAKESKEIVESEQEPETDTEDNLEELQPEDESDLLEDETAENDPDLSETSEEILLN